MEPVVVARIQVCSPSGTPSVLLVVKTYRRNRKGGGWLENEKRELVTESGRPAFAVGNGGTEYTVAGSDELLVRVPD